MSPTDRASAPIGPGRPVEQGHRRLDRPAGSVGDQAAERGGKPRRPAAGLGLTSHRVQQARLEAADSVGERDHPSGEVGLRQCEQTLRRAGAEADADDVGPGA